MTDNSRALENGFAKARLIIRERAEKGLMVEANKLAYKAFELYRSPLMGFTGQTWTGTAVGVFSNGENIYTITTRHIANMPPPVRSKLRTGKVYFLKKPYGYIMDATGDGGNRFMRPVIDTDGDNSEADAIKFLRSYKPSTKYAIVVVNGSEYASYIEGMMDGDVLVGTYHYAHGLRAVDLSKAG